MITMTATQIAGQPDAVWIESQDFGTEAEAVEWAAQFPKSAKLRVRSVTDHSAIGGAQTWHDASVVIGLGANGVNGGVNETGLRRLRTIERTAARLGERIEWNGSFASNAYPTREAFDAAIGGA